MDDDGEGLNPQQEAAKRKAVADKHQEDLINHMDAVTKRLHSNKKRGRKLFQRGLGTLEKSSKFAEFLKFDDAASFFYKSYISYKICSQWLYAGESLMKCAEMHVKAGLQSEAVALYVEAAETLVKANKSECMRAYAIAVDICIDLGRFDIAGKIERELSMRDFELHHWEEAALGFKKAANYLAGDNLPDQSDWCMEKCAECYVELKEYEKASQIYLEVAKGCLKSNLRRLTVTKYLYWSVICLIGLEQDTILDPKGEKKYERVKNLMYEYEDVDFAWASSDEMVFLENIIDARLAYNQHMFADHLYFWDNVRVLRVLDLRMFKHINHEINEELQRREEQRIKDEYAREFQKLTKGKMKEKKKLMDELGIKGKVELSEEDIEALEIEARKIVGIDESGHHVKVKTFLDDDDDDSVDNIEGLDEDKFEIPQDADADAEEEDVGDVLEGGSIETDDIHDDSQDGMAAVMERNKARADKKAAPERRTRAKKK